LQGSRSRETEGPRYTPSGDFFELVFDKLYSPQMVVTANTTKYTIQNHLTKKEKKKKQTNKHTDKWHVLI